MANDRNYGYPHDQDREMDYGRDYGSGRDDRNFRGGGTGYGDRDYRPDNRGGRETYGDRDYYGGRPQQQQQQRGHGGDYADRQRFAGNRDRGQGGYGRAPQGYDYQDRGFVARAGDEVRSWFGDEDAERRRDYDQRYDERMGRFEGGRGYTTGYGRDADYSDWRKRQMDDLDRDYHEYRTENAKKFENEFHNWRTERQTQRSSLSSVKEHMEVVGSDGQHVGTVDKVRGDRILLTKGDADAGGRHHSIPSRWIRAVDDKVTITKTADEAHAQWRDEERSGAMFGDEDRSSGRDADGTVNLNRSFSGTY